MSALTAAVQEQINLMYASAKYAEDMQGNNATSIRLRQFADKLGDALRGSGKFSVYAVDCGCCGPWIRNENGVVSEFSTEKDALKGGNQ